MRVFSINHGHLNILYEYNSRPIFAALSNGSTLRRKSSLYLGQQSSPGLSSEKRFEGGWWAQRPIQDLLHCQLRQSLSCVPELCTLSCSAPALGCWWGRLQGQINTGLIWSQASPPCPRPNLVCESWQRRKITFNISNSSFSMNIWSL